MFVDTSRFPFGINIDYESDEEVEGLQAMEAKAREFIDRDPYTQPIAELILAFGIESILALFLVRFVAPRKLEDSERWVVVGNCPSMHFETDDAPTPAIALRLYCAIAQDWADNILAGDDLDDSYPIAAAETEENARDLLSRIEFVREELIPLAEPRILDS
ncbi:hypothetical protein [Phenylobacterium sp.]|jgi:hypothetical protein|uniref:hypothetical protein n=1 Tax=Phenylobacterium sp. TaxID=1871053 RepID=UPI0037CC5E97